MQSGKAPESTGAGTEDRERSTLGIVSVSVEPLSGVGGVQNQDGDADMLVDTGVSIAGPSRVKDVR